MTLKIAELIENQEIKQEHRPRIGGSFLGIECSRQAWYKFRWFESETFTPRMIRLFQRGHTEEIVVAQDLINAGCKIDGISIDKDIIKRFREVFNITLPDIEQPTEYFAYNHGSGSRDALISNLPDIPKGEKALLEVKTSNEKGFVKMKMHGVRKANRTHFVQIQTYMHIFKLKWCLYVMTRKETDERHYEIIKYDKPFAKEQMHRAEVILKHEYPPPRISEDEKFYLCSWCTFKKICHKGHRPKMNCRTCKKAGIRDNGVWVCENKKKHKPIKFKKQLKGCKHYQIITTQ